MEIQLNANPVNVDPETQEIVLFNPGRLLLDGIPHADLSEWGRREREEVEWFDFWAGKGEHYAEVGEGRLEQGFDISGGELLWLGSLCYHYAQYLWMHEPERRESGQRRKVELYKRAAPYLVPAAERVEISFEGNTIPGYLRLPEGYKEGESVPCGILLGGMESTKEEGYLMENLLLRRGVATFAFDGPGQGEMWFDVKIVPDFERYTSAVLDFLLTRAEIDSTRIGVLGRSMGGHYALKSASTDHRVKACASWGGVYNYNLRGWRILTPRYRQAWAYLADLPVEETGAYMAEVYRLDQVIEGLRCPLYILDGYGEWEWIPQEMVENISEKVKGVPIEWDLYADGDHCAHNKGPAPRFKLADWFAREVTS